MAGKKKVPERRSCLRPSEKELPERRSVTKITLVTSNDSIGRTWLENVKRLSLQFGYMQICHIVYKMVSLELQNT
jgi:hypothetical protein